MRCHDLLRPGPNVIEHSTLWGSTAMHDDIRTWYMAYLILGAITSGLVPVLVPLMVVSHFSHSSLVAYVMGAYNLGLLSSPLWGVLAERTSLYRTVFFSGFLLLGIALASLPFSLLAVGWTVEAFVIGCGSAAVATVATLFIIDFAKPERWESQIGYLQSFNGGGQVLGLLLAAVYANWAPSFGLWIGAALTLVAVTVGSLGLPKPWQAREPGPERRRVHAHLDLRALAHFPRLNTPSGIGYHFHSLNLRGLQRLPKALAGPFGRLLLTWWLLALAVAAFFAYLPVMFAASYEIDPVTSSLIYAAATAIGVGLFIFASEWTERFGAVPVYRLGLWIRLIGFALLGIAFIYKDQYAQISAAMGLVLIVLAWPALSVAGTSLAARMAPFSRGAAIGLLNAALACGIMIGTFASGPLVSGFGFPTIPIVAIVCLTCSLVLSASLSGAAHRPNAK